MTPDVFLLGLLRIDLALLLTAVLRYCVEGDR